jgi:PAS domain S-box-containing protein
LVTHHDDPTHEPLSPEVSQAVLERLEEGILLLDASSTIVASNPSAARLLGVQEADLRGLSPEAETPWSFTWEDGSPMEPGDLPGPRAVRTGDKIQGLTIGVRRPDGSLAWLSISAMPLGETDRPPPYPAISSFVDITEPLRAHDALHRHEEVFRIVDRLEESVVRRLEVAAHAAEASDVDTVKAAVAESLREARGLASDLRRQAGMER